MKIDPPSTRSEVHVWTAATGGDTVRQILARYLDRALEQVEFTRDPGGGKPSLAAETNHLDLRYNLSHSSKLLVVAIARGIEVGVDVERVRPVPDMDAVAERFFAPAALKDWFNSPPDERQREFFHHWTRLEAQLKADGRGIDFLDDPARARQLSQINWSIRSLRLPAGFEGAVAVHADAIEVVQFEWTEWMGK
jgi:4'-phosphopantetheinyl transferase